MRAARCTALLAAALCVLPALAHRLSPAFFGLTETEPNVFAVQWKVSISGGLAAVLEPQVPAGCSLAQAVRTYVLDDVRLQHATLECPTGLPGQAFAVNGLAQTQTDVLLRVDYLNGSSSTQRLTPAAPSGRHPRTAEHVRRRAHVSRARRRAHPARHRSFAVRARIAAARERRRPPRRDRYGLHGGAQHHARRGDLGFRPCSFGARRSDHCAQHPFSRLGARTATRCCRRRRRCGGEPDDAVPVGRRVLVRSAARVRLRRCAQRGRRARASRAARTPVLQCRSRARPALVHRGRVRVRLARAAGGSARAAGWQRAVAYGIGSVAAFWVVERTIAVF